MLFLDDYKKLPDSKVLLIPILQDSKKHYTQTQISFIYIFGLETYQEQILNLTHNDCLRREISILNDFLGKDVYCYKKKYLSDYGANLRVYEAELVYWFETNKRLEVNVPNEIRQYWNWYSEFENINDCVPIMKWIEYCREVKDRFLMQYKKFELTESFLKYNELLTNLEKIERNGVGSELCEYNPFTLTGRPSNHFNGINYAALNKSDGSRKRFVSRHKKGFLVEVDLSGFHLYLIYTILGLKFPESIYDDLKKYYPKDEDPKTYTFKQIYGGITKELQGIEPFRSISNLSKNTFLKYKTGNLKTFLYDRPIKSDIIEGDNQTKIFNYMLQNLETEFNNELLTKIHLYLSDKSTKFILYTYDSFLFDYDMADGNILGEIVNLFEDIPLHIKAGLNYHEMLLRN